MNAVAQQLFARILTEADIKDLAENSTEALHLDFKEVRPGALENKQKTKELDKLLAKAFSGFSNADGGVLVLGVDDKSRELRPYLDLEALEERVNERTSRLVAFPVPGLSTRAIVASGSDNFGFVTVYVPASELAPHRSQQDHRYYRRSGESFIPMEHYEVADMFGPSIPSHAQHCPFQRR